MKISFLFPKNTRQRNQFTIRKLVVFLSIFATFLSLFFFNVNPAKAATQIHKGDKGDTYITVGNKNYNVTYDSSLQNYYVNDSSWPGAKDYLDGNAFNSQSTEVLKTQQIGTGLIPTVKAVAAGDPNSPGIFESALSWIITMVLGAIRYLAATFLVIAAYFLNAMLSPSLYNFTSEPIITTGWAAVRDVCNLFFLLVLLFIAFCTILQIEKYHAKKILLTFILMALLVNFSKPIAIFIFDGSQLLMNFFLAKMSSASGAMSFSERLISNAKVITAVESLLKDEVSSYQLIAKYIFAIIFYFMAGVAFFVMAANLLIRIIVLWLLIILSPFAFLFNAVPDFKKISSDWWDAIFKYSYIGPSIAFFLWLSTYLTQSSMQTSLNSINFGQDDRLATWAAQQFIPFIVILVFLYASIIISQKFGIAFAGAITSRANKALSYFPQKGWQGMKYAGRAGANWTDRRLARSDKLWWLSPTVWKKTMAEQKAEAERKSFKKPTGRLRDKLNKYIHREETRHEEEAIQSVIAEKEKEHGAAGTDIGLLYEKYLEAKAANKTEDMTSLLRLITSTNEGNSFMIKEIGKERMQELMAGGMSQAQAEAQMAHEAAFNPFMTTDRYIDQLMAAGFSEHMATKQVVDMGLVSVQKGMFQLHGAGAIDKRTRKYRRRKTSTAGLTEGSPEYIAAAKDIQDRINDIQGKINETRAQGWADTFHWTSIFNQNADGSVGDIHTPGLNFLGNISGEKLMQIGRIRGDGVQRTYEGLDKIRTVRDNIQDTTIRERLTKFITAIENGYQGKRMV